MSFPAIPATYLVSKLTMHLTEPQKMSTALCLRPSPILDVRVYRAIQTNIAGTTARTYILRYICRHDNPRGFVASQAGGDGKDDAETGTETYMGVDNLDRSKTPSGKSGC